MNRKFPFLNGEYYHIYNRGVDKRDIFSERKDVDRFIESIIEFNTKNPIFSLKELRIKNKFVGAPTPEDEESNISGVGAPNEELVSIFAYCLNPNHFHFFVKQEQDNGISKFMQKLQGGYTSYFNTKYERSGSLFQGKFKSHPVRDDVYFKKVFGYVNKNYLVHSIPEEKKHLVFASDYEYETNNFTIISSNSLLEINNFFYGIDEIKKNSEEVVSVVKLERGYASLNKEEVLEI